LFGHTIGNSAPDCVANVIDRALDVGSYKTSRRLVRIGDGDEGGEMDHRIVTLYEAGDELRILNIAGNDVQGGLDAAVQKLKVGPRPGGVVADHGGDGGALILYQRLARVAADKTARPGDQNPRA